jgi:hypothetical protein
MAIISKVRDWLRPELRPLRGKPSPAAEPRSRPTPSSGEVPATPPGGNGERPAGVLGPAAFRGSYGSAPAGACGAAGRSTALPAMQHLKARRLLAAFFLAPR